MATGSQVKALLESHVAGDDVRFLTTALQIAAREAKRGHGRIAKEIRELVDEAKRSRRRSRSPLGSAAPPPKLVGLVSLTEPTVRFSDMVLGAQVGGRLRRVLRENAGREKLRAHGLSPRRKILLAGPPGTGKTMTAKAFAGELHLPLFTVLLDGLISKFMGESAARLRLVFEAMVATRGVYLFDECDAIFAERDTPNDVGESRRVLNSLLQLVDQDESDSLIVAVTNHRHLLDRAIFRRFDDVIEFQLPRFPEVREVVENTLAPFDVAELDWSRLESLVGGLSYADVVKACEDAAKLAVLEDADGITTASLESALAERQASVRPESLGR